MLDITFTLVLVDSKCPIFKLDIELQPTTDQKQYVSVTGPMD